MSTIRISQWRIGVQRTFRFLVARLDPPSDWNQGGDHAMRIAQIAPLAEAVPPKLYGGTERVVSWLTEELVRLGHDVTLFATGDSVTSSKARARLRDRAASAAGLRSHVRAISSCSTTSADARTSSTSSTAHIDLSADGAVSGHVSHKVVSTMHGRLDVPDFDAGLQGLSAHAAGLDLRQAARADAAGRQLALDRLSRPAGAGVPVQARTAATISRSSAASRRKSGPIARSRSPSAPASSSRSPPRSTTSTRNISSARSSRCSTIR